MLSDRFGELTGGHGRCALEHQMFEKVRKAGLAGIFINRTNPVPDHVGHNGCPMVFDDHQVQAVIQRILKSVKCATGCNCIARG